ncbi:MAG: FtsX-like permease family protein [Bacteroidetes bacterium]|nr:FtsX-like permease family protein [Bacteroidota bacterium]
MFQNNFKLAWRSLLKSKYTSAINLFGLVIGMTAAILLWQYVAYEKSYDSFNDKADRIVRVRTDRMKDGVPFLQFAAGAACAGPLIHKDFPEVEDYLKMQRQGPGTFAHGERFFREEKVVFAASNFFHFFTLPMLSGNPENCLKEPFTACISASLARKYFGTSDPMGQTLKRNGDDEFKITGVFNDWPENSHLKPDILLSYVTFSDVYNKGSNSETSWDWDGFYTYLLLRPDTDVKNLESKIHSSFSQTYGAEKAAGTVFLLQPLRDIHLTSHYLMEAEPNGDAGAVRSLLIISFLVLLIAWFNYVNLATARSETRAKEVGVRKAIGSSRSDLVRQFMLEAGILNLSAIFISVLLAQLLMPAFEHLAGKPIPFSIFREPKLWGAMVGGLLLGTVMAGLYPSAVLSSYKPSEALSGNSGRTTGSSGSWLRKGLVVTQFAASVVLMVGTLVIFRQLSHMQHQKLGVNVDQVFVVKGPRVVDSTYQVKYPIFKEKVTQLAGVEGLTVSTEVPGQPVNWTAGIRPWGGDDKSYEGLQAIAMDFDFPKQYGLEVAAGRMISEVMASDSSACMLNEQGAKRMKFATPEAAIGKDLDFWGDRLTVVGVVKDFHQQSPKLAYEPLIFRLVYPNRPPGFFSVKVNTADLQGTIAKVQSAWSEMFPGNPFDYFFLDDHFAQQYEADQRLGSLTALFAALAIFVSCLGLFALAAFVAERRTKEIGIRKVLGASVQNLVGLLSKEFLALVLVALVVATPVAWYAMNHWLQNFESRISLQWWFFVVAGLAAIGIAFFTMSFQSIKAALANPMKSLRSE